MTAAGPGPAVAAGPAAARPLVRLDLDGHLGTITLDRPERGNALDAGALADLDAAITAAERAPACRVLMLRGTSGVFCTGMDLAAAATAGTDVSGEAGNPAVEAAAMAALAGAAHAFFALLRRLTTSPLVIAAAVDGQVSGGGVGLVAACDVAYASARSAFSLPEALWGLLPCSVLPFLIRRAGFQTAQAMTLTTLAYDARQAESSRLVDRVDADPETLVRRLAHRTSRIDPEVIADGKRYLGRLYPIDQQAEELAVGEFARLLAQPAVRRRIVNFTVHRKLPWEV